MKNIVWAMIFMFATASLVACSGGGGGSDNNSSTSLIIKGTSGNAVNLNGTWQRCDRKDQDQMDSLTTAVVSGNQITMNVSIWSAPTTSNCLQTTSADATLTQKMTATLGSEATATWTDDYGGIQPPSGVPDDAMATKATLVYNSAVITLNSTTWVSMFNTGSGMCGKKDWAVGVPTNVMSCTSIIESPTDIDYWVVDDSSTPLKLYTQNTRTAPYQVDSVNPLVKQ